MILYEKGLVEDHFKNKFFARIGPSLSNQYGLQVYAGHASVV